jgi:hypothetical protein
VLGGYSSYYAAAGSFTSVGTRVQWKLSANWRVTAAFATQVDSDGEGSDTRSFSGSLAAKWLF